jgi:hypothetical protein
MKYLKKIKYMNEDVLVSYDYTLVDENSKSVKYEFSDDFGNNFLVVFKNDTIGPANRPILGSSYEVIYFVEVDESEVTVDTDGSLVLLKNRSAKINKWNDRFWSIDKIVSTKIYKLMETILGDIVSDFLLKHPFAKMVRLEGLSKDDEVGLTKRTKLYKRHLSRNILTGYSVEDKGNKIFIVKK